MSEMMSDYLEIEATMKESERVADIVHERGADGFQLPPDFDPAVGGKEGEAMRERFDVLEGELLCRGFEVQLDKNAPLAARYLYAQHIALVTEGLRMPGSLKMVLDGCAVWCDDCFQHSWCSVRKELDEEEAKEASRGADG